MDAHTRKLLLEACDSLIASAESTARMVRQMRQVIDGGGPVELEQHASPPELPPPPPRYDSIFPEPIE